MGLPSIDDQLKEYGKSEASKKNGQQQKTSQHYKEGQRRRVSQLDEKELHKQMDIEQKRLEYGSKSGDHSSMASLVKSIEHGHLNPQQFKLKGE